jgi:hypothetical protein
MIITGVRGVAGRLQYDGTKHGLQNIMAKQYIPNNILINPHQLAPTMGLAT